MTIFACLLLKRSLVHISLSQIIDKLPCDSLGTIVAPVLLTMGPGFTADDFRQPIRSLLVSFLLNPLVDDHVHETVLRDCYSSDDEGSLAARKISTSVGNDCLQV